MIQKSIWREKIKNIRSDSQENISITPCLPILINGELSMNHLAPIPHKKTSGKEENGHLLSTARALLFHKNVPKIIGEKPYQQLHTS